MSIYHGETEKRRILIHEELTEQILSAAIEVHTQLGPGLMESTYEECLCYELNIRKLGFQRQVTLPVQYKNVKLDCGYRIDLIVEEKVLLELKSVEKLLPIHTAQLLTYLKLSKIKVGFILNFNEERLRNGIIRKVV